MTKNEFLNSQFDVSFVAGMNQSYHQYKITEWQRWDLFAKMTTCTFATLGAVLSVATAYQSGAWLVPWGIGFSLVAAVGTYFVLFTPFADWAKKHEGLFDKWTCLRRDADLLLYDLPDELPNDRIEKLRSLIEVSHDLDREEKTRADNYRLRTCEAGERQRRGLPPMQNPPRWYQRLTPA